MHDSKTVPDGIYPFKRGSTVKMRGPPCNASSPDAGQTWAYAIGTAGNPPCISARYRRRFGRFPSHRLRTCDEPRHERRGPEALWAPRYSLWRTMRKRSVPSILALRFRGGGQTIPIRNAARAVRTRWPHGYQGSKYPL